MAINTKKFGGFGGFGGEKSHIQEDYFTFSKYSPSTVFTLIVSPSSTW